MNSKTEKNSDKTGNWQRNWTAFMKKAAKNQIKHQTRIIEHKGLNQEATIRLLAIRYPNFDKLETAQTIELKSKISRALKDQISEAQIEGARYDTNWTFSLLRLLAMPQNEKATL